MQVQIKKYTQESRKLQKAVENGCNGYLYAEL